MGNLGVALASEKGLKCLFILGFILFFLTGLGNVGVIAMDDYYSVIAQIIPAQTRDFTRIIGESGFRAPHPNLALVNLSKLALHLGIVEPVSQLRFILAVWGGFSFLILGFFSQRFFDSLVEKASVLFLVGFYFLSPLFFTRPMIESLSAPFLLLSVYLAQRYFVTDARLALAGSLVSLVIATLLRFQVGVCFVALLGTTLWLRNWKDSLGLIVAGALAYFVTGYLDGWIRGEFHYSLFAYVAFNRAHSSGFGVGPFYLYLLLFLGLSLPPTFLSLYRGFDWKKRYQNLVPVILYFSVFVIAHSIVPHKEERFMVPALPLFFVLLTPLIGYFVTHKGMRWRIYYFLGMNFLILFFATVNVPQNNVIGVLQYLQKHPSVERVLSIQDSMILFPSAYVLHKIERKKVSPEGIDTERLDCDEVVAVRMDYKETFDKGNLKKLGDFSPGLLESLVVRLNPRQNARRGPISLYGAADCRWLSG